MFLSGGLDSLALMRQLCDAFPPGHPARVRDAFFAYGIDVGLPGERPRHDFYQRAREGLEVLCRSEGMELVPVWTNLRGLLRRGSDWPRAYFGLGTVSIAHAFSARVSDVAIAASVDVFGLAPNGSHPMLDPYFSSSALAIRHDGLHQNRLEKAAVVAAWPEALPLLRVCYNDTGPGGPLNCGRCRKCVRTMLALLALGRLGDATSFPVREVTPAMVEACTVDPLMVSFYEAVLEPLEQAGREDLARELRRRLSAFARRERWSGFRRLLLPWR
jgi:hypothetical protein